MDMSIISANDALVHVGDKGTAAKLSISASELLEKKVAADTLMILIIDSSGSMGDPSKNPRESKLMEAKTEAERFIQALPAGVRLAVISGNDGVRIISHPGDSRDVAIAAIRRLSANGGTSIDLWIDEAVSVIRRQNAECIVQVVILTDGQHYAARNRELDVAVAKAKGLFDCYAIGFGEGIDFNTLNKLATLNGEMFSAINGDLGVAFSQIIKSAATKVAKFELVLGHEEWIKIDAVEELFPNTISRTFTTAKSAGADMPLVTRIDIGQFGPGESKDYLVNINIDGIPANNDEGYLLFTAVVTSSGTLVSDPVDVEFTWCSDPRETARFKDTSVEVAQKDVTTRKLVRAGLNVAASNPDEATKKLAAAYEEATDPETKKLIESMGFDPQTKKLKTLTPAEIEAAKTSTTKRLR
jgi:hypothetical protein